MSEKIFVDGMSFKKPRPNAPDFVKGSILINVKSFGEWFKKNSTSDWISIDIKKSKNDKLYLELNTWKPITESMDFETPIDEIPF